MKREALTYLLVCLCLSVQAQVPLERPDYSQNTLIAPRYFGPNAFPVPDMLDGSTSHDLRAELAGDGYYGFQRDMTADIFARIHIPLFTDRVNLTVWMPIMEFYRSTEERIATCRIKDENKEKAMRGHEAGDVYVSTDIMFLREKERCPAMSVRAAVKTASGGGFQYARTYDAPGYFFDLSIGKTVELKKCGTEELKNCGTEEAVNRKSVELRFAASAGFLCWQTANGRQNDAVMYGALIRLRTQYVSIEEMFKGYVGWEKDGDRPMVISTRIAGHVRGFEPYVMYQYGIMDYPFHQLRIGLVYNADILSQFNKRNKR